MTIAIETATEVCGAALVHRNEVLGHRSVREKNIHSERLLTLIDEILHETQIPPSQLDGLAVSIGPGSFTGLRIGVSAAKGLAMALDIPVIAVPTLDGIAEGHRRGKTTDAAETFCSIIDAKRDEAFYAFYSVTHEDIVRLGDYSIKLKNDIIGDANGRHAVLVQPDISAIPIGLLAERKRNEYLVNDFSYLEPLYLRDFVATMPKKNAGI